MDQTVQENCSIVQVGNKYKNILKNELEENIFHLFCYPLLPILFLLIVRNYVFLIIMCS
jgi:hypothetical protein